MKCGSIEATWSELATSTHRSEVVKAWEQVGECSVKHYEIGDYDVH